MPPAYLKGPPALPSTNIPYWCAGKERFESAVLANEVADRSREKNREIYRCRSCGGWHLGDVLRHPAAPRKVRDQTIR